MAELSFPKLTAESVSAKILDAVRRPNIEIVTMEDAIPPSTSQVHPPVSVTKAREVIAQARSKSVPRNRRYSLSKIQRQHRLNESIFRTLAELTKISQRFNDPPQKLDDRIDFLGRQATTTKERTPHTVETAVRNRNFSP
jgi:hypothetical protein